MNKLRIALISLIIAILYISSIAGTILYYNTALTSKDSEFANLNSQINQLQTQNDELNRQLNQQISMYLGLSQVKISSLGWVSGFNPVGSVFLENQVKVTVKNEGNYDVSGINLTLSVSLQWLNGDLLSNGDNGNFSTYFSEINAGESKEFQGYIRYLVGVNPNGSPNETMLVGQLCLNNVLLDEKNQTIANLYY